MNQEHKPPKRLWSFSLRSLLVLVTLSAFGILAKQQWDHQQRLKLAALWIDACAQEVSGWSQANGMNSRTNRISTACPDIIQPKQQIGLLVHGAIYFDGPESPGVDRRVICLKLLAENHAENAINPLIDIALRSNDPTIQKLAIHLVSLYRERTSVEKLSPLMDSNRTSPIVRAALVDLIGLLHASTYSFQNDSYSFRSIGLDCHPVIDPTMILAFDATSTALQKPLPGALRRQGMTMPLRTMFPTDHSLPLGFRDQLNEIMMNGLSSEERIAAARAIVAWPPDDYELRYAEWGVWLEAEGHLKLSQSLLEEIPAFVHQTGNPLKSFEDRIAAPMIVFKPVVHLTTSHAMAVDLEVNYFQGRPWYAYPKPDDFSLNFSPGDGWAFPQKDMPEQPKFETRKLDNSSLTTLPDSREGYPWLLPPHRTHRGYNYKDVDQNIAGLGLRWQSLIVSPTKQAWMKEPATASDPRYQWWKNLRKVDCSWISSCGESEKFLFYDGPTLAKSPLKLELAGSILKVSSQPLFDHIRVVTQDQPKKELIAKPTFRDGFFIEVDREGNVAGRVLKLSNEGEAELDLDELEAQSGVPLNGTQIRETMRRSLSQAGLRNDEADGLLDSWQAPFFESSGQRVIYLLTPAEYDQMIRMNCRPAPTETVRVGLVMKEFGFK